MHPLFSALAKLLGVLLAYWGLTALAGAFLVADAPHNPAFTLVYAAVTLGFALVLVFRTESLARGLGVAAEPASAVAGWDTRAALRTGIVLIGLYVFLIRLSGALHNTYAYPGRGDGVGEPLVRASIELLPLALAVAMVLRADRLAALLLRAERGARSEPRPPRRA